MSEFKNTYKGKSVLITGHTGFKGSWLSLWLHYLGARVYGFADQIPTRPSFYEATGLEKLLTHHRGDIRISDAIKKTIESCKPDFVFHLAAQALVKKSFQQPLETLTTNGLGTAQLLLALRDVQHPCTAVIITSDKCYENVEWVWGYKETDRLGGKDPYSASKAVAEIIFHSFFHSYYIRHPFVKLATARAGNVIGGGDWANDRIVPDCIKNWAQNTAVEIRRPRSTRPWQHVLEPLSGYLHLGASLAAGSDLHGESYNFGPLADQNHSVQELIELLTQYWTKNDARQLIRIQEDHSFYEAGLLKLNTDKALAHLKWKPVLDFHQSVKLTGQWYDFYYKHLSDIAAVRNFSLRQIDEYILLAQEKNAIWTT